MFKSHKHLGPYVLATGRVLPGSDDLEAFLNNDYLAQGDEEYLEICVEQLQTLHLLASNQNARADWAWLYRDALEYLGAKPSRR